MTDKERIAELESENERLLEEYHRTGKALECSTERELGYKTKFTQLQKENSELKNELKDRDDWHKLRMSEDCPKDEVHCSCVPDLKREIKQLQKDKEELVKALGECVDRIKEQVDDEECSLDHHGYCQTHCQCTEVCWNKECKKLITTAEGILGRLK